jgi:hypothetical protein
MTQQRQIPDLPETSWEANHPPKRRKLWLWITLGVAVPLIAGLLTWFWPNDPSAPWRASVTTHTVLYEATADAAYGSGRTGMVTAQAPGGTTQRTGLLPITGTYMFHSGDFVYLSVQNQQPAGSVTCRITVDGTVVSENTSTGGYTIASCKGRVP